MPFCPNCGKEIINGNKFCPECGFNIETNEASTASGSSASTIQAPEPAKKPKKKRTRLIVLLSILILLLCGIGFGALNNNFKYKKLVGTWGRQIEFNAAIDDIPITIALTLQLHFYEDKTLNIEAIISQNQDKFKSELRSSFEKELKAEGITNGDLLLLGTSANRLFDEYYNAAIKDLQGSVYDSGYHQCAIKDNSLYIDGVPYNYNIAGNSLELPYSLFFLFGELDNSSFDFLNGDSPIISFKKK